MNDPRLIALKRIADELHAMRHKDLNYDIKWHINESVAYLDWAIMKMGEPPMKEPEPIDPVLLKCRDKRRRNNNLTTIEPQRFTTDQVRFYLGLPTKATDKKYHNDM